ncbi:MAG TPA: cyclic nucleotide-binding domain-containing protein [Thiotrichaceae bacterium]|jgi:CRP-like cAMP-binding protein|nr:cyclic nucleotide-binding domain-containing protein [Thiotrichaceae bacterium]HIM08371.1 cyclic nucleotide-binding domain-containing protein [Gammaproteobacteria bacterium]
MALQSDIELINVLQSLVPISNLSKDNIELIAASSNVQSFVKDYIVFSEGDNDEYAYYLLEGELELISMNSTNFHVVSGTDDARYPLAQFRPRQYTAKAKKDSLVLVLNRTFLDSLLVRNKTYNSYMDDGVEVTENIDDDDWMSRILQSPLYTNISVDNIQKIFSKIESMDVKKGDVIIKQGDEGDYYYIIQSGHCCISRKPTPTSQDINLADLREGDAFGEESIIADLKRNASVTMTTDGRLIRLNKKDFIELILEPILHETNFDSAQDIANKGAIWLDVRYVDEYQDYAIEGSLNIPLNVLRLQIDKLDDSRQYITCCDTAARSSIAAYILAQHGYDVLHLNKGLKHLVKHEDIEQVEIQVQDQASEYDEKSKQENSTNVVPFKNNQATNTDEHVLNSTFHDEMNQLRKELDLVREQFKELEYVKDIAADLKKSVIVDTEKKLKIQKERINLQTQNANKLILQAQEMHKELKEEKRLIHEKVEKHRIDQEQTILNIQDSINKSLLEEEKKMQVFYTWKENEINKIRDLKIAAEREYLSRKIENELEKNNVSIQIKKSDTESVKSEAVDFKLTENNNDEQEEMHTDLKEWLGQQVKNEMSPINKAVQNAKRRVMEQANLRAGKMKQISKMHDQALFSEIDTLLKGVED